METRDPGYSSHDRHATGVQLQSTRRSPAHGDWSWSPGEGHQRPLYGDWSVIKNAWRQQAWARRSVVEGKF